MSALGGRGFSASHGAAGSGTMRSLRGREKPPPLMDPSRERDRHRILRLFAPYKWRLAAAMALIAFSAGLGMVSPFLLREVFNVGLLQHNSTVLAVCVGGMIAIAIVTAVFSVWQTYMSNAVGQRVMHDLRSAVYQHLQRMSLAFFTRTRTGEVQSRIANDIGGLDNVLTNTATTIAQNATTVIASIVAMLLLDWRLALISLAFLPLFVFLTRRVGKARRRITMTQQRRLADLTALVAESLSVSGIMLGKTMGRGGDLANRFTGESSEIADLEVRSRMAGRWVMSTIQMTFAIQPAIVYFLAGQHTIIGTISIGTVIALTSVQTRLLFPIQQLLGVGADVEASLAFFDRIFEYLDLPVDITEAPDAVALRKEELLGEVRFDDVSFRYSDGGPWTVRDIDLVAPAGTRTAIVGETGAGKTTLGYLVARLYDPQRGQVKIDGVDIRDVTLASLAQAVGVVSQETYLFHASVRENLRFAAPEATDAELEEAARTARIHDLIVSLPDGYDTIVGERGYRFSGGEKQRMAIARTILRNPPVLVLDEATSSLDTQTEAAVQQELERLAEGRTTIAIAHRLSTVRDADQIVVLDAGRIVERGTHEQLLEHGGVYASLVARDLAEPTVGA
ncbi:MAG TPA: ABC transporter ATP-binding protein [Solirubrobacteraceae bacterium]|jgi:ATP-binding cassette, subfamily B, bacterial|nr:ABC transporter ATP-binding protein [Solirubrobacteraceae bacterium]